MIYRIQIQGVTWKCIVFENEEFVKRLGEGIVGLCDHARKQIFFTEDDLDLETVVHEMVHAYYSQLCTSSANLTHDQIEEIFCEMFAKHGALILRQSRNILKKLRE
jgi:hypothetical protein